MKRDASSSRSLGGAAAAWPLAARAQQPIMPVVGFLNQGSAEPSAYLAAAFRKGLGERPAMSMVKAYGFEYRWAGKSLQSNCRHWPPTWSIARWRCLRRPSSPAALAAKAATSTIPICFVTGADPVEQGLVASLNRPGGNVTGVAFFSAVVGAKRLRFVA